MMLDREDLKRLLDRHDTDRRDTCPSSQDLVEAASPGGDPFTRDRVADHLIDCAQCAEEYRLLGALRPWAAEHAHLVAGPETTIPRERPWRSSVPWAYATAAALAVVVAALAVQVVTLLRTNHALAERVVAADAGRSRAAEHQIDQQRRLSELEQRLAAAEAPDLNAPIIDLEPGDAFRSAGASPSPIRIPGQVRRVVLVLNTSRQTRAASYDVEIVADDGRVVWSGSGLTQSRDATLTLVVPRSLLGERSRIRLYSRGAEGRALVEQYVVRTRS